MTLARIEDDFQRFLLDPGLPDGITAAVTDTATAPATRRLGIYAEAYRLRLVDALVDDFPAVQALLGDATFGVLARSYLAAHPSAHWSLRWFGRHLADFLAAWTPPANTPDTHAHPAELLSETAAFEWALTLSFDAVDEPVLGVEAMSAFTPEQWPGLTFRCHASVQRLDLRWNAPPVWKAAGTGAGLPIPSRTDNPVAWLLWRQDIDNFFRSLDTTESLALDCLRAGGNFAEICESLAGQLPEDQVALHAATLLKGWLVEGLITEVRS